MADAMPTDDMWYQRTHKDPYDYIICPRHTRHCLWAVIANRIVIQALLTVPVPLDALV